MVKFPEVGMKVKVINTKCCNGHKTGTLGKIITCRHSGDTIEVEDFENKLTFYQCKKCIEKVK